MSLRIRRIVPSDTTLLSAILRDCVASGASVSFMHPLEPGKAAAFWHGVADGAARGERIVLVAENEEGVVGTVQVVLAQPDNQPHRADVSKLLVSPAARRCGAGEALMRAAERAALEAGRTLLVLDTASDDARRLYERLGWELCGRIPGYALWPEGGLADTYYYFKQLGNG